MATFTIDVSLSGSTAYGGAGLGVRGTVTLTGNNYVADNQNVGTSAELVTLGDVGAGTSFVYVRNSDATNYCTLYSDGASGAKTIAKLYPGQAAAFFGVSGMALGAKANTAGIVLEKLILENVAPATLEVYTPSPATSGYGVASVSVNAVIGSTTLAIATTDSDVIVSAGSLSQWAAGESGYTALWPDALLAGGNNYGTVFAVNQSATTVGDLAEVAGTTPFGELVPAKGFALLPINASAISTGIQADTTPIAVAVVATRKTI